MTMKNYGLALLSFLCLLMLAGTLSAADNSSATQFKEKTASSNIEMAKNWALLSVGALMLSVILIGICYAVGIGFEMPELQAWAGNELVQVITNAIIIGALIATIAFIEVVVLSIATTSNLSVPECQIGNPASNGASCLQGVTDHYLGNYVTTAEEKAKAVLKNNVDAGKWMNRGLGITCISIYCLQVSVRGTFAAENVLNMDKYGIVFEYYSNLLSFMESQRFFVKAISFNMAPVVLAIGIVMRSFSFSRKLGGLLMAIAIGIMFFFPGMYIFDWLTLDYANNGDKAYGDEQLGCPAECLVQAPLAYFKDGGTTVPINNTADIYLAFKDGNTAQGIINGSIASAQTTTNDTTYFAYDKNVQSCNAGAAVNGHSPSECPQLCRELPYPTASQCVNKSLGTVFACAAVPDECKVRRIVQDINQAAVESCPPACKVVPPLRSNCNVDATNHNNTGGDCLLSAFECRMAQKNESAKNPPFQWRPTKPSGASSDVQKACNDAKDCVASLDANQSCVFVVPPTGLCDDICAGCPSVCRIDAFWDGSFTGTKPSACTGKDPLTGTDISSQCKKCHAGCMMRKTDLDANLAAATATGNCTQCEWDKLIAFGSDMPDDYTHGDCSYDSCPIDYRVGVPRNVCDSCLFNEEQYMYDPPINTKCSDLCKPPDNAPVNQPGTTVGADGLAGDADIQDLSRLMVPVYVLPLFNIVATLVFIKGLSTFLGGDIEIPGISKVF